MNHRQKIVVTVGLIVFVLMGLVPPWLKSRSTALGYGLIFYPPRYVRKIDVTKLIIQWTIVVVVTGGLVLILKDPDEKK